MADNTESYRCAAWVADPRDPSRSMQCTNYRDNGMFCKDCARGKFTEASPEVPKPKPPVPCSVSGCKEPSVPLSTRCVAHPLIQGEIGA